MTDEELLLALDAAWNAAYPACDTAALDQILAADWTAIDGAGRSVDKARLLEAVGSRPNPFAEQRFYETRLRLFGDAAVVTGRVTAHGVLDGQPLEIDQRYTRVYVKTAGRWQAVATQVTPVRGGKE